MSATESSPFVAPGKGGDQPTLEEPESPRPPTNLSKTQQDPSDVGSQQTVMSTEAQAGSQPSAESTDVQTDTAEASQHLVAAPSQPDLLAGQVEALSLSVKVPESGLSSTTNTLPPPPPPEKDDSYLNSNSTIPATALQQASAPNSGPGSEKELPDVPGDSDPETKQAIRDNGGSRDDNDSQPEIQNIMGQFQDPARTTGQQEIMSPRLELAEQFRSAQHYFPPRRSSLDPVQPPISGPSSAASHVGPAVPARRPSAVPEEPTLTRQSSASTVPPPPEPEPNQPFDFHRFLEQLRHRTADPVAKFLRSFLTEFAKKQWMAHEQVKIISDFLAFITNKMAMCEVWRDVSDAEFDNAKEGMEKLVMNRLYSQTFSPAIPAPPTIPRSVSRSRRREIERLHGPWRRGQHQEDIERDDILAQKIRIYSWVSEEHLDIAPVSGGGRRFLSLAQQELLKINGYRAPRDKVICILNCCKVIFGLLRNSRKADTSADAFIPLLIYVVLHANPDHLVSNIQYILRFRNQEKLGGEAGYYLSSLTGAIQFIETLDRTSLTVSDQDFERNVEAAVSAIAEQNRESESLAEKPLHRPTTPGGPAQSQTGPSRRDASQTSDDDTPAPVAGLLRTIQKPLSTIGRIFSDDTDLSPVVPQDRPLQPAATPQPGIVPPRLTPDVYQPPRASSEGRRSGDERPVPPREKTGGAQKKLSRVLDAQDAAARQASAEEAEAQRIQHAEHNNVVETLSNMFPNLDRDLIDDVVKQKEGRVGLAVDACLALSAE
ncbi:Vacuolar protein sorting-associated protein 9a [Penicillium canariense]|uniref:Vacuolar protein sorting-associated protein 9a n=1 Tax=Penicillium canariense TaxID=189055 RepID=A0A9W9I7Q2_9EURO|nr:Vacuolar protein sorting-associated protein 9a [Penicillium canariense]KAJ5168313.1 Vacuolar protein sorting-associated protein 9a [Penicillium canariense]